MKMEFTITPWILVLGANSDMGIATAKKYAASGYNIYLASRNIEALNQHAQDIQIRHHVECVVLEFDACDFERHQIFIDALPQLPTGILVAFGYMTDQLVAQENSVSAKLTIDTNFTSAVCIIEKFATMYSAQGHGFIVGISSVAGDRGRKSNYIYGASKAGFTAYMAGLSHRFYNTDITVLTVKPGFVYTKMTQDLDLPANLTATPDDVALAIKKGVDKNKGVIYVKPVWRLIMLIIKLLPGFIFNRTNL
jgi:short-subunit dehydrogenase